MYVVLFGQQWQTNERKNCLACDNNSTAEQAQQEAPYLKKSTPPPPPLTNVSAHSTLDALVGKVGGGGHPVHEAGCLTVVVQTFRLIAEAYQFFGQIPLQLVPQVRLAVTIRFGSFVNCTHRILRRRIGA